MLSNIKNIVNHLLRKRTIYLFLAILVSEVVVYYFLPKYSICGDTSSYTYQYDGSFRTPVYPAYTYLVEALVGTRDEVVWLSAISYGQRILFFLSVPFFYLTLAKITKNKPLIYCLTYLYGASPCLLMWNVCILTESFSIIEFVLLMYFTYSFLKEKKQLFAIGINFMLLCIIMTRPAAIYLCALYGIFWVIQMLSALEAKKKISSISRSIKYGIFGFFEVIFAVVLYCVMMYCNYGVFGLSTVSYTNKLLTITSEYMYNLEPENEISKAIKEAYENLGQDIYIVVCHTLKDSFSRDELEEYADIVLSRHRKSYIGYLTRKSVILVSEGVIAYTNSNFSEGISGSYVKPRMEMPFGISFDAISDALFPVSYGAIILMSLYALFVAIKGFIKNKIVKYDILIPSCATLGCIAVFILAAPFEPQRLCILCFPSSLILIASLLARFSIREN